MPAELTDKCLKNLKPFGGNNQDFLIALEKALPPDPADLKTEEDKLKANSKKVILENFDQWQVGLLVLPNTASQVVPIYLQK